MLINGVLSRVKVHCTYSTNLSNYGGLQVVKKGLALTPADIKRYTDKGIAVSTQNAEPVYDGSEKRSDFTLDPIYARDTDRNTLWEASRVSRAKILAAKDKLTVKERQARNMED
ncbi:hypothetical protein [Dipodfec virus UOA04_Rod_391]|nr:hypothetical protein [Dipodfec virus UOA04_Rod_391]